MRSNAKNLFHLLIITFFSLVPQTQCGYSCLSNPCVHGVCLDDLNSTYSCYCIDGYTGVQCQTNWDECWSGPCRNGGTCVDGIAAYNCTCPPGFVGDDCEENYNECLSNPCLNNATCVDDTNGYECRCLAGYAGNHCEIDVAVCNATNEARCSNGGVCMEGPGATFTCRCPTGWTGIFCDLEVDECMSNPCQNGAVCIDLHAEYECACPFGYAGKDCEELVLMCDKNPCRNDALCLVEDDRPVCYCVPDFHGDKCQMQYDECQLSPNRCHNGGTCIDGVDGFTCSCPPQLTGLLCECLIVEDQYLDCSQNVSSHFSTTQSSPVTFTDHQTTGGWTTETAPIWTTSERTAAPWIDQTTLSSTTEFIETTQKPDMKTTIGTTVGEQSTAFSTFSTEMSSSQSPLETTFQTTMETTEITQQTSMETTEWTPSIETSTVFVTGFTTQDFFTSEPATLPLSTTTEVLTTTEEAITQETTLKETTSTQDTTTIEMTTKTYEETTTGTEETTIKQETIITTEEAKITTEEAMITTEEAMITTEEAMITTEETIKTTEEGIKTTEEPIKPEVTTKAIEETTNIMEETTKTIEETTKPFEETTETSEETTIWESTTSPWKQDCTKREYSCLNGGSCIYTEEESYSKCVCPFDYAGSRCQTNLGIKSAAFMGDSYLIHRVFNNQIQVEFIGKTKSNAGLLFYSYLDNTYMALFMENGFLRFKFSCGFQTMLLSEVNRAINDGHSMKINASLKFSDDMKFCNASIRLNESLSMSGHQMATVNTLVAKHQVWVYLGGTRNDFRHHLQGIPGFVGCMSDLLISGKRVSIFKDAIDGYKVTECSSLACLSNPCQNGGLCSTKTIGGEISWTCSCKNGFSGESCEKSVCDNNPCEYGATCLPYTGSGYICLCPYGKHGHFCENDLRLSKVYYSSSIQGYSSYTAYSIPKGNFNSMEIKFRFTPTTLKQISLLMFMGQDGPHDVFSDHMAVSFVKGYILLTWNLGSGPRRIFTDKPLPADKASYQIRIGRQGRRSWLYVDHLGNVTGRSPGSLNQLDVNPAVYFGGYKSKGFHDLPHDLPLHSGFSGCIYDIEFKTGDVVIPLETNSLVSGRSVGQCGTTECHEGVCQNMGACLYHGGTFTCLCQDGFYGPLCSSKYNMCDKSRNRCYGSSVCVPKLADYACDCPMGFKGSKCSSNESITEISFTGVRSFLSISPREFHSNKVNLQMDIRPLKSDGLIFLVGVESFVSISLVSGLLELRIYSKSKHNSDILLIRSNKLTVLGQWHKVRVQIYGRKVYLFVDNVVNTGVLPIGTVFYLGTQKIHIGGLKDLSLVPNGALSELPVPYKGCIRHLSIDNQQVDLFKTDDARNLVECDGTPCGGEYCLNGGTCWLDPDLRAHCTCPEGYTGTKCEETPQCAHSRQCHNGGFCDDGRCVCQMGYAGAFCQASIVVRVPKFKGTSFMVISGNTSNTSNEINRLSSGKLTKKHAKHQFGLGNHLRLNFTTASDGLLVFLMGDRWALGMGVGSHGELKIIEFPKRDEQIITNVGFSGLHLSDGFNHRLELFSNTSTIEIDSHTFALSFFGDDIDVYLGGLPQCFRNCTFYKQVREEFPRNFKGCVHVDRREFLEFSSKYSFTGQNIEECSD